MNQIYNNKTGYFTQVTRGTVNTGSFDGLSKTHIYAEGVLDSVSIGTDNSHVGFNMYNDGIDKYSKVGFAGKFEFDATTGLLEYKVTNLGGLASDPTTFTSVFSIDKDGNVAFSGSGGGGGGGLARNGLVMASGYTELGGNLTRVTDINQPLYGQHLNIAGNANLIIGAKSTDADYATYDDLGLLGLLNREKTDGSVSRFALIQLVNRDTNTQRGIYAFFRNPNNYKVVVDEFDSIAPASMVAGTGTISLNSTTPFSGSNCLRVTGQSLGSIMRYNFTYNTGKVTPYGTFYFMLNGEKTVAPAMPSPLDPKVVNFKVRILAPDNSNYVEWSRNAEVMGDNLWTGVQLNASGGTVVGSPDYTNITGLEIENITRISAWYEIDKLEWFSNNITNQFIRQSYGGGERVYIEYGETRANCEALKGEYFIGGEARGGYQNTPALADAHSLKSRNFIYKSSFIDLRGYGNQLLLRVFQHKEGIDVDNTNPDYYNKCYSSLHQEVAEFRNEATKQVSPFKWFNIAKVTNPIQSTNYQNSNDSVYTFFDNGGLNTVDTMRVIRGLNQSFGSALAVHQGTVNTDGVNVFEAWQVNSTVNRRGLVMRGDGRVIINGLWTSDTVNGANTDQIHGTNKPFGLLHVHGMIGGNAIVETANFTVGRGHFVTQVSNSSGTKTITLPPVSTMYTAPLLFFFKNTSDGVGFNQLKVQTSLADLIDIKGTTGTNYTAPATAVGVFVTQVGSRWKIFDLTASGTLV